MKPLLVIACRGAHSLELTAPQGTRICVTSPEPDGIVGSHRFVREATDLDELASQAANSGRQVWVAVRTPAQVERVAAAGLGLWLRGSEVHGDGQSTSALVLIRAATAAGAPWLVEGLGRRGMAAALAVGATGLVIDAHTWRLDGIGLLPAHQALLQGRSGRDTGTERTLGPAIRPTWSDAPESGIPAPQSIGDTGATGEPQVWLDGFWAELDRRRKLASTTSLLDDDPLGTGVPVVQGPMANVAEKAGLARAVQAAGGLPFCALGALKPAAADRVLEGMDVLEGRWGAGVIGFDVMPWRDDHLASLASRPGLPVILAGGSPQLALKLQQQGLEPWLHTPSGRLCGMAVRRGVRAVVLEGREAGGHVGALTSVGLWEEALAVLEEVEQPVLVVLAGGIGDATSAAFATAFAASAHARGHRIALQLGTAFFFTHEIVEAGQITGAYQQAAMAAEHTVLVGDTVGLPLRCAPNDFTQAAIAAEHATVGQPEHERREAVERFNLGRTRIAAKGIERDGHGGYQGVPAKRQIAEGAFTMGEGALVSERLTTVAALIDEVTRGASRVLRAGASRRSRWGDVAEVATPPLRQRTSTASPRASESAIAIVGLGCVLPGAPDVAAFWELLLHGIDAIRPIPDERWRADRYFDPSGTERTRSYVRMGGVVDGPAFDPVAFGIPPAVVPSLDRAQILALLAAKQAVQGLAIPDRSRAAVVLGNSMGGEHAKSLAVRVRHREVLAALGQLGDPEVERQVEAALASQLPPVDVESMSGLLSNVIAGRVASWLDLMGGNQTVDAACAASLAAITTAVDWLRAGRVDLVLTGGVDADLSPETYVGFCRTHALSRHGGKPFSSQADGFVMGEGAAVLALKRLEDARAAGDRVWAVIEGIGVASDGRSSGITAPRAEGQRLAIERALADAGVTPEQIDLVEAHGTGTALGDRTELSTLASLLPAGTWVGSVKSQIGHLKGGAGAAGVLKATLALAHRVLPPTLNAAPPSEAAAHVRLPSRPVPLAHDARAGVSAFGFGGTDHHLVLRAADPADRPTQTGSERTWTAPPPRLLAFGADDYETLAARIETGANLPLQELGERRCRLVCLDATEGLATWVRQGRPGAFGRQAWLSIGPVVPPVWVFPGQGSPRDGAFAALRQLPAAARLFEQLGIESLDESADPASQHHLLVALGAAWSAVLADVPVAGVIGHSVGELAALVGARRLRPVEAIALADARGSALNACPAGGMVAVRADAETAARLAPHLRVAALNGPASTVLAGSPEAVAVPLDPQLQGMVLDVERAFHTPDVAPAEAALRAALASVHLQPGAPWWSNVPGDLAPAEKLARAVTAPVDFLHSVRSATEAGHALFLHVGPGAALARHIESIAPEARVIRLQPDRDPDLVDVVRAAAELAACGHPALAIALPGLFVERPFPLEPPVRPTPTASSALGGPRVDALREAARQVLAALGEPVAASAPVAETVRPAPRETEKQPTGVDVPEDDVRSAVISSIVEVTGYPAAALQGGARLDTDLGIDSIRKLEIVGLVQDKLGRTIDESALATAGPVDLDGLVAWIEGSTPVPEPIVVAGAPSLWAMHARGEKRPTGVDVPDFETLIEALNAGPVVLDPTQAQHVAAGRYEAIRAREAGRESHALGLGHEVALPADPHGALPENPVVLATGGATGIVARCLQALPGARGVLLGRRPDQTAPEGFDYLPCDLLDADAVHHAARTCRARYGRIDLVLHGAGVLRDRPASELTVDDRQAVLAPKVTGARHLIDATTDDAPLWVVFSSVAGPMGNPGQAAYAAANAWLERLEHPMATRSIAIRWSAWSEVGMAADPTLQKLLSRRGIHALSPAQGAALFLQALRCDGVLWASADPPPADGLPWPLTGYSPRGFAVQLAPDDPVLGDHRVGGSPLVPGAVWVRAMLTAAEVASGAGTRLFEDLAILAPTFVREPVLAEVICTDDRIEVRRGELVVARARVRAVDPPQPTDRPGELDAPSARDLYRQGRLFHGPTWQMLRTARFETGSASAEVHLNGLDPVATLVDGAHQLLACWAGQTDGRLGLPVGAACWEINPEIDARSLRLELSGRIEGDRILGDVTAIEPSGRVAARAKGVELKASSSWGQDV